MLLLLLTMMMMMMMMMITLIPNYIVTPKNRSLRFHELNV